MEGVTMANQVSKMAADGRGHGGQPTNPRWLPMEEVTMANQISKMATDGEGHDDRPTQDGRQWKTLQRPTSTPRWPPMEEAMLTDPPKMAANGSHPSA